MVQFQNVKYLKEKNEAIEILEQVMRTQYTDADFDFARVRSICREYYAEDILRVANAMARFGPSIILDLIEKMKDAQLKK